jgi:hypothetical protein
MYKIIRFSCTNKRHLVQLSSSLNLDVTGSGGLCSECSEMTPSVDALWRYVGNTLETLDIGGFSFPSSI